MACTVEEVELRLASEQPKKRGLKKGVKYPQQFKKGHDPRRDVRHRSPDWVKQAQELAGEHLDDAIAKVVDVMHNSQSEKNQLHAAQWIVERVAGKSLERVATTNVDGTNGTTGVEGASRPHALSDADLRAIIYDRITAPRLNHAVETHDDSTIVDAEVIVDEPDSDED